MAMVQKEVSDRSGFGKLIKWIFIVFNILMFFWMITGISAAGDASQNVSNDAERAGAAIGTALGVGLLLFIWGVGDVILGMFVLFTRRKKIITVEE
ncbi:hypothetical protein [Novosphingobium sp.]|uniref:hypothetical protein n=1 Tax=Novosphingobium sp. TaxID=1874826 RepID=UPI003BABEE37